MDRVCSVCGGEKNLLRGGRQDSPVYCQFCYYYKMRDDKAKAKPAPSNPVMSSEFDCDDSRERAERIARNYLGDGWVLDLDFWLREG